MVTLAIQTYRNVSLTVASMNGVVVLNVLSHIVTCCVTNKLDLIGLKNGGGQWAYRTLHFPRVIAVAYVLLGIVWPHN